MIILPAIDLRDGRCVRLTQGRKDSAKVYDGDPVDVARAFAASGAEMLHVVDLDGAFAEPNSANRLVLREIVRAVDIPIQFGGGLRRSQDVEQVIELGVTRVVIGTVAVESPDTLTELVRRWGSRHIAVGIDAQKGRVVTHGWEQTESISALTLASTVAEIGVERIIYTDVARDGMLHGPNIEQTCLIAGAGVKVTASGGVSSLQDLKDLQAVSHLGIDSVIIGKAFYERRFTLEEALKDSSADCADYAD
jgi:phosphoribosylformimino-5-aminoimidazole carboxamide ribotide isomerase